MTAFAKLIGRQLRQPSGLFGHAFGFILNRGNRRLNRRAVERLGVRSQDAILDVGFGGGVGLRQALACGAAFAAGIEISEPMLHQGLRRFRREISSGRVELKRGEVSAIPYEDERFDCVFSANTIYFWPDPAAGLTEILRVLKPGGRLVLGTATVEAMERRSFARHGFRFFTEAELEALLKGAGLAELAVDRVDDSVFSSGRKAASSRESGARGDAQRQ